MARRAQTLPISSASNVRIKINANDWKKIEKAYGHILTKDIRNEVLVTLDSFARLAAFETHAEPLAPAIKLLDKWKLSAENLRSLIIETDDSDGRVYVVSKVRRHFRDPQIDPSNYLQQISGVLTSFIVACTKATSDVASADGAGFREGESWNELVRQLTKILERNSLPTESRQDGGDLGAQSQFTKFVFSLQETMPLQFKRHQHSPTGLARAIQRARSAPQLNRT